MKKEKVVNVNNVANEIKNKEEKKMKNNYWKENYLNLTQMIEEEKQMAIRKANADYGQNHLTTKEHEKLVKRAEEKARVELAELKKLAQIEEEKEMKTPETLRILEKYVPKKLHGAVKEIAKDAYGYEVVLGPQWLFERNNTGFFSSTIKELKADLKKVEKYEEEEYLAIMVSLGNGPEKVNPEIIEIEGDDYVDPIQVIVEVEEENELTAEQVVMKDLLKADEHGKAIQYAEQVGLTDDEMEEALRVKKEEVEAEKAEAQKVENKKVKENVERFWGILNEGEEPKMSQPVIVNVEQAINELATEFKNDWIRWEKWLHNEQVSQEEYDEFIESRKKETDEAIERLWEKKKVQDEQLRIMELEHAIKRSISKIGYKETIKLIQAEYLKKKDNIFQAFKKGLITGVEVSEHSAQIGEEIDERLSIAWRLVVESEEAEEVERTYLKDLVGQFHFNPQELNENWIKGTQGWYTKNPEEINWIRRIMNAYEILDELNEFVDPSISSYDELIAFADRVQEERMVKLELELRTLTAVYSDHDFYDLQFDTSLGDVNLRVKAIDHPEAETNEDYFENEKLIFRLVRDATLEDIEY